MSMRAALVSPLEMKPRLVSRKLLFVKVPPCLIQRGAHTGRHLAKSLGRRPRLLSSSAAACTGLGRFFGWQAVTGRSIPWPLEEAPLSVFLYWPVVAIGTTTSPISNAGRSLGVSEKCPAYSTYPPSRDPHESPPKSPTGPILGRRSCYLRKNQIAQADPFDALLS